MKIKLTSLLVEDQAKALAFYTDVLGFQKKQDIPVGEYRWITVVAPGRDDLELTLEPNANPAAKAFQVAWTSSGMTKGACGQPRATRVRSISSAPSGEP